MGGCVGNIYISRVAKKLMPLVGIQDFFRYTRAVAGEGDSTVVRQFEALPWTIDGPILRSLINYVYLKLVGNVDPGQLARDLAAAVETDPTVCPYLADALEEGGCTHEGFLEALRTP